jgi:protein tyrosine phosphatase
MEKQPRSKSLSIADAIAKLCDAAQVISRRGGLKPSELKRVREAAAAITESNNVTTSDTEEGDAYQQFLRKVFKNAGPQMVVLCAAGLGRTAVKGMKDRVRVDLPFELKDQATSLESTIIRSIVDKHMQIGAANNTRYQCG